MSSFQTNLEVKINSNDGQMSQLTVKQEAVLTNAVRRAVFDALTEEGLASDAVVTIRGPETTFWV